MANRLELTLRVAALCAVLYLCILHASATKLSQSPAKNGAVSKAPRNSNHRKNHSRKGFVPTTLASRTLPVNPPGSELKPGTIRKPGHLHDVTSGQENDAAEDHEHSIEGESLQPSGTELGLSGNTSTQQHSWHVHQHINSIINMSSDPEEIALKESQFFVDRIFQRYGQPSAISVTGLAKLMENIGLAIDDDKSRSHATHGEQNDEAERDRRHNGSEEFDRRVRGYEMTSTHVHDNHTNCHPPQELLSAFHFDNLAAITSKHFLFLCPALIDQLDNTFCHRSHGRHHHKLDEHGEENDTAHAHERPEVEFMPATGAVDIPPLVWLYSSLAVLVISLVGLLGVAVIPVMRKLFYKSLLQFLVALAVGALSGDALLHLIPHAISGGHSDDKASHDHATKDVSHNHDLANAEQDEHSSNAVWKGLVSLLGLFFFFLTERIVCLVTSRPGGQKSQKVKGHAKEQPHHHHHKKSGHKSSAHEGDRCTPLVIGNPSVTEPIIGYEVEFRQTDILSDDEDESNIDNIKTDDENGKDHSHGDAEVQGHNHGHSHHVAASTSIGAVAWMVILGDGIHNFSDGLAIGAAFASSVTGGFSTTVAVFCHELPHEIGDFAVLLQSGMSAKHALFYNILSSVLCFFGMVGGVLLGHIDSASTWIFAAVGGMFLYISLADMLPQISVEDTSTGRSPWMNLLIQCIGVSLGAGIMLVIAVFEHDIQQMLE